MRLDFSSARVWNPREYIDSNSDTTSVNDACPLIAEIESMILTGGFPRSPCVIPSSFRMNHSSFADRVRPEAPKALLLSA